MILESLQEENINMCHFLLLHTPIFFSGEGKKKERRNYIVFLKLKRNFILMWMRKRSLILQLQGFSYFRFVALFIQNVHDEEIT